MRSVIANRAVSLTVLGAAIAAAAGLALWKHTVTLAASAPQPQPRAAPVNTVLRACPAPGLTGAPSAHVALIAGQGPKGSGRAVVTPLGQAAGGTPLATVTQPGALSVTGVRPVRAPARGKTTERAKGATPSPAPPGQPVATVPAAGGVVIQAVGPGVFIAPHIRLFLMNVSGQPADVTVQAFTDAGPLQGSTDTGVAVAPHSMVSQSLDKMLHGTRMVALEVRTSVGQVVAAVQETTRSGHTGTWLPVSAAPGTRVVVPALPAAAGTRQLFLAVPGTRDAHITLNAITAKGSYRPTGGAGLDIPGGSVAQIALPSLSAIYGALQVSANVPVTASLMVPGGQRGSPGAFTAAAPAIQQQGVVAANVTGAGAASSLVLSAPWRGARVRLTEIGSGGQAGASQPGAAASHARRIPPRVHLRGDRHAAARLRAGLRRARGHDQRPGRGGGVDPARAQRADRGAIAARAGRACRTRALSRARQPGTARRVPRAKGCVGGQSPP